jgi:glyoxylase-like metal-dependent hydrolase (beta-lactamase superfamily II)
MSEAEYDVFAIKYAHHVRPMAANFVDTDPHDAGDMPLDYFIWVLVHPDRTVIVDTGFDSAMAARRSRTITRPVVEGLEVLGVRHQTVEDVVVTHLHHDHCGNGTLFPHARYHVQDAEMAFATGRCMCHRGLRTAYEAEDVQRMVGRVFTGHVQFHDGPGTVAPGITLHKVGGHTQGLQIVRVATKRGFVVLASDASHFYAHMETGRAFPILYNMADVVAGYETAKRLASSPAHVVPGHDPLVLVRYPAASPATAGWIARLDADPRGGA